MKDPLTRFKANIPLHSNDLHNSQLTLVLGVHYICMYDLLVDWTPSVQGLKVNIGSR